MANVRFVGFPQDKEEELTSRLKKIEISPKELVYSFVCSEVKNLDKELCPYIEIRTTSDKKGRVETNRIIEEFSEFDTEAVNIEYRRGKKIENKHIEVKLST